MNNFPDIAIIDCQITGISGDKFLASLIDLGADIRKINDGISIIPNYINTVKDIEMTVNVKTFEHIKATQIKLKYSENYSYRTGNELLETAMNCLDELKLSQNAKDYSLSIIRYLINAEAKIHNSSPDEVHLHEAGSVDTLIDSIGSAIALEDLNLIKNIKWLGLPVAVGSGSIKYSHGLISTPAPATLEILKNGNIEVIGGPIAEELTTPTGAAIMASLNMSSVASFPQFKIKSIGYGVGTKTFPGIPNVMRLVTGFSKYNYSNNDEIIILETNLDDISGEILGYTINKLISETKARDAFIIPIITKKNRPGHILKVITDIENEQDILKLIMEETGTLGVRRFHSRRYILDREEKIIEINYDNKNWKVRVKIVKNRLGKIIRIKPEFSDIIKIAEKLAISPRLIQNVINNKIQNLFFKE